MWCGLERFFEGFTDEDMRRAVEQSRRGNGENGNGRGVRMGVVRREAEEAGHARAVEEGHKIRRILELAF